jgi:hypothetical protein
MTEGNHRAGAVAVRRHIVRKRIIDFQRVHLKRVQVGQLGLLMSKSTKASCTATATDQRLLPSSPDLRKQPDRQCSEAVR